MAVFRSDSRSYSRRRGSRGMAWGELALYSLLGLVVCGGLVGGGLYAAGVFDGEQEPSREGQLACPSLSRPVEAYSAISREDLIDPQTGQLSVVWLPEATAEQVLRDLSKILGRVTKRDKTVGMALTEADFFSAGTRPGLAAGIPPGKRAVSIETDQIEGLSLLRMGDRFDLIAALPADAEAVPPTEHAVLLGGVKPPDTRAGQLARQTGVRTLVRGGQMIALSRGQNRSTEGQQGLVVPTNPRQRRDDETTIATVGVDPEEVTPLTEALTLETRIVCVTYSGRADDETTSVPEVDLSGMQPVVAPFREVEAFGMIRQEDLVDPVSGRLNEYYFQPALVDGDWLASFADLVGRVPRRNIAPGEPISEDDLMPAGTRPGLVAGAPAGTVVIQARADRLPGVDNLSVGDQLSVYRRLPADVRPSFPAYEWASALGGRPSDEDGKLQETLRSGVQQVATGVVLLGRDESEVPEDEKDTLLLLAVPEESAVPLTQALESEDRLSVAAEAGEERPTSSPVPMVRTWHGTQDVYPVADFQTAGGEGPAETFVQARGDEVAVPVTARPIEPFTRLSAEDFVDPATGRLRIFYFPRDQVDPDWVLSVRDLIDRVPAGGIGPGRAISRDDLLPPGTGTGIAAGIPEGYAAVEVTSFQVDGLSAPALLDRIDLFASRSDYAWETQLTAEWPDDLSEAVFFAPDREDIYAQADTRSVAHSAILLSREARTFEFLVDRDTEERESGDARGDGAEIGPDGSLGRPSVRRTRGKQIVEREGLACVLAVPVTDLHRLTEALSAQRHAEDDDDNGGSGNGPGGTRSETGSGGGDDDTINEVLIYAVIHSSRPGVSAPSVPDVDSVAKWVERWSARLRQYVDASGGLGAVQQIEQIRGRDRDAARFIGGLPATAGEAAAARRAATLLRVLPGADEDGGSPNNRWPPGNE